jgi:hypothetical protein
MFYFSRPHPSNARAKSHYKYITFYPLIHPPEARKLLRGRNIK